MSKTFTSKQYFSQLTLIYFAQAALMLIFTAVVFMLVYLGKITVNIGDDARIYTYILAGVVVVCFSAAHFLYDYMLARIDKTWPLTSKMPKYIGVLLVRSACMELPGFAAAIVFFLNGNFYLLLIPVLVAVVFIFIRPTKASIVEDLQLSPEERSMIENPDAVIAEGK
ncbi:MAG TPA: hypothetical protein VIN08_27700 [Ohtaekwangia sp.]|uniref:hypothetical protein n=1 Tax=Ohtaekwangia sp. TaxID=2066019 RepID=UPI002F9263B6